MFEFLGPILSGIGSVASSLTRGPGDTSQNWQQFNQNYQNQKEFAQHGIRWKVADAQAAGIHPLFALGGSTASYSPSSFSVGDTSTDYGLKGMGQAVDRAVQATRTASERQATDFQIKSQELDLEGKRLNNDILRMKLASDSARLSAGQIGPPMPQSMTMPGVGIYEAKAPEVANAQPGQGSQQAGPANPQVKWEQQPDGSILAMPTGQMDDFSSPGYTNWMYQNRVLPYFNDSVPRPPNAYLPPGATGWVFKAPGAWYPTYKGTDQPDYIWPRPSSSSRRYPTHGYTWGTRAPTSLKLPPRN